MPAPSGNDFLGTLRVNEIRKDIQDVRTIPGALMFLNRLNRNPSLNRFLTAKWKGNLQIADLIAPNSPGVAYQAQRTYLEASNTQSSRIGTVWSADLVEEYYDIKAAVSSDPDGIYAQDIFQRTMMDHVIGTEWRMEWLAVAMATDGFYGTSSYNRLGFSLLSSNGTTPTWGMKPDMKSFVQTPLGNPDGSVNVSCPIITYIFNMIEIRRRRYGKDTNRITMPTAVKRAIQQTTEFKNDAVFQQAPFTTFQNITPTNYPLLDQLLSGVLKGYGNANQKAPDLEVVTYDSVYQTENGDGLPAQYVPFLPLAPEACIILDDSRNDRNDSVHDFAIGTTMESRADPLRFSNGAVPAGLPAGKPGTFSYFDMPSSMNPVSFGIWTTARMWPRKFDEVCESVLFVGPLTDPVPLTDIVIV
jgi:hypothetical protein